MGNQKKSSGSFRSIFMHSDGIDKLLMGFGFIGSLGDGLSMPIILLFTGKIMNNIGGASITNNFSQASTRTAERQASRMRSRYLKAVLRQDVGYFDLHVTSTAEVITSVSSDSLVIQDVISEKVPVFLMNLFTFIGAYIVAFAILWRLAIVAFPFVIFLVIPGLMYGRALMGIARKMRSKTMRNYSIALQGTVDLGLKQGLAKGLAIGSNGIVFAIWSLGSALSNLKYFSEASAAGERILVLIKRVPKIDSDNMDGQILERILGEVEFKNVEFAYPSRPDTPIFQNFNLKIPSGLTVALVGGSGSGKSTVIALLQRFYDPMGGEICLDGVAIDKLQLKWLRSQMGLVGERGVQMSGGQKQRIAIARAIIKAPRILLLDEATSALDSESERVVQDALDNAAVGRTTVIIAHRLSTIRNANVIAVVQNGQVNAISSANSAAQSQRLDNSSKVGLDQDFPVPSFRRLLAMNLPEWRQAVRSLVGDRMALLIQTFSAVTIACTMGLIIAWRLALVMIAVQPLVVVCFYLKRVLLKNMSKKALKAQEKAASWPQKQSPTFGLLQPSLLSLESSKC
ncbi:hypothetical protein C3L33_01558, partial [Rhododendron williamsianum]